MMKKLCCALLTLTSLAACATDCQTDTLPEAAYDVSEETMAALEDGFDTAREDLPCEAICLFVADVDEGWSLEVDACELELLDPSSSDDPDAVVAHLSCGGELVEAGCEAE